MTTFIMIKNNVAGIQDGHIPFCMNESSLKERIKNLKVGSKDTTEEEKALKALEEQNK